MLAAKELENPSRSGRSVLQHRPIGTGEGEKLQPRVPVRSGRGVPTGRAALQTNLRSVSQVADPDPVGQGQYTQSSGRSRSDLETNGTAKRSTSRPVVQVTTEEFEDDSHTHPPFSRWSSVHTLQEQQSLVKRNLKNPLVVVCLTVLAMVAFWWCSTAFFGWCVMHISDTSQFGPQHGNSITAVIGGGDSQQNPSKLIAMNNDGVVEILKITANDPTKTQLLTIANLTTSGFPDPTNANIELQAVGDRIQITMLSTVWNLPFSRIAQTITLAEDGNGGLKVQQ